MDRIERGRFWIHKHDSHNSWFYHKDYYMTEIGHHKEPPCWSFHNDNWCYSPPNIHYITPDDTSSDKCEHHMRVSYCTNSNRRNTTRPHYKRFISCSAHSSNWSQFPSHYIQGTDQDGIQLDTGVDNIFLSSYYIYVHKREELCSCCVRGFPPDHRSNYILASPSDRVGYTWDSSNCILSDSGWSWYFWSTYVCNQGGRESSTTHNSRFWLQGVSW